MAKNIYFLRRPTHPKTTKYFILVLNFIIINSILTDVIWQKNSDLQFSYKDAKNLEFPKKRD